MTNPSDEPRDPKVEQLLQSLRPVPERSPQAAANGRARFLSQAAAVQPARNRAVLPVSASQERRHIGWFEKIFRKELPKMSVLTTLMLVLALVFGGSGAAYAAAQQTLPDQPLYGLKLAGENVQLQLTANHQNRLELALKFSQRRVEEMEKMAGAGKEIPASVQARWQQQVQEAVKLAYNMPDEAVRTQAMLQVHTQLQTQARLMSQAADVPLMQQVRQMIQQQLRQVEQIMTSFGPGGKPEVTPAAGGNPQGPQGSGPGEPGGPQGGTHTPQGPNATPQGGNTPQGPNATPQGGNTPQGPNATPQGGNTPQGPNATPQGGNTPQGGSTPQGGGNSGPAGTPTPGSGYGPGPGSGTNTPAGPQGKP